MTRPKVTTTTRQARGRERALSEASLPLAYAAALDAIARMRAAGEPLDRCMNDVGRQRRFGPRERRALGDVVFAWARLRGAVEGLVDDAVAKEGGIKAPIRDRDLAALLLAQIGSGLDVDARARAKLEGPLGLLVDELASRGLPVGGANLPPWLAALITRAHPTDHVELLAALALPAPLALAVDTRHAKADDVARAVGGALSSVVDGAVRAPARASLRALATIAAGTASSSVSSSVSSSAAATRPARVPWLEHVWPMDDGSQAVVRALGARAGEVILDLCAGGGGKSRLLASTGARVVAADVNLERLSFAGAAGDVHRVVDDGRAPAFRPRSFDRVLVDAPCTGTGTLRRAPDLAQRLGQDDVARFGELQRALLSSALDLVKPGGVVVYATCSLLREENGDVVDAVVAERAARTPAVLVHAIPLRELWGDSVHVDDGGTGRAHLLPHLHGTDAFFVAALRAP